MKISSNNWGQSLGILVMAATLWSGCATQNANRMYFEAEDLLKRAMAKVGSNDPQVSASFSQLTKGEVEMLDAHYDVAVRYFRESMKMSRDILDGKASSVAPTPTPEPVFEPLFSAPKVEQLAQEPAQQALEKPREKKKLVPPPSKPKRKLPAAKVPSLKPAEVPKVEARTDDVPKNEEASSPAKSTDQVEAIPSSPEPTALGQKETHRESVEAPISENIVVVAPAAPTIKPVPKSKVEPVLEKPIKEEPVAPASKAKVPAPSKRRIPGTVSFVISDASILADAMTSLNQTVQFLLENPSTTLLLQGQLAPQEATGLNSARYESIRSYLVNKGVPEDQIQIENEAKRGKNPEFQMFVIEH